MQEDVSKEQTEEVEEPVEEEKPKINKKKLKKKKFKVNFQPKFKKGGKKGKKLAAQKIDVDLDFNVMTVGDVVGKKKKGGEDPLADLKKKEGFGSKKIPVEENKPSLDKYKGMTGIGSDMLKGGDRGPKMKFKDYKNVTAMGSDQLNGNKGIESKPI